MLRDSSSTETPRPSREKTPSRRALEALPENVAATVGVSPVTEASVSAAAEAMISAAAEASLSLASAEARVSPAAEARVSPAAAGHR